MIHHHVLLVALVGTLTSLCLALLVFVAFLVGVLFLRTAPNFLANQTNCFLQEVAADERLRGTVRDLLQHGLEESMCKSLGPSMVAAFKDSAVCDAAGDPFLSDRVCKKLEAVGGDAVSDPRFAENLHKFSVSTGEDAEV